LSFFIHQKPNLKALKKQAQNPSERHFQGHAAHRHPILNQLSRRAKQTSLRPPQGLGHRRLNQKTSGIFGHRCAIQVSAASPEKILMEPATIVGVASFTASMHFIVFALALLLPSVACAQQKHDWVLSAADTPRLERVLFDSKAMSESMSCYVFTPESYDTDGEARFPVLYWLHGSGGSSPASASQVVQRYGEAMRSGKTPPMIIVFPNGLPMGMWCDWKDDSVKLETVLIKDLIPHIDRSFRTLPKREGRIIEGFSMGGYGAARLGFKHPHLFAAVSLLGAGPLQPDFSEAPRAGPRGRDQVLSTVYGGDMGYYRAQSPWHLAEQNAEKLRSDLVIRQIIGDRDETLPFNREFKQHLDALKIPHTYRQLPDIPHNPNLVLNALGDDNWAFYRQALGASSPK
jgi:enterochelin esterase-like enzyme